jgi:hypothetical protein
VTQTATDLIKTVYFSFNERNIDAILVHMHPLVRWPNGWEGGYVHGHNEVRNYWTRQWKEINPIVTPLSIEQRSETIFEVAVHQLVSDMQGKQLFDGMVKHVFSIENGIILSMEIEH